MEGDYSLPATALMIKSYFLSAFTFLFGALSVNEIATVIGMMGMFITIILNWYYRSKTYKLELMKFENDKKRGSGK